MPELPLEEHQPVDPTPAANPLEPHGPPVDEPPSGDSRPGQTVGLAPHPARLLAFAVDVLIIAAVLAVPTLLGKLLGFDSGFLFVVGLVVGLVSYLAVSVWLTGQTIGKALFGLTVRRIDGSAPPRTLRGLAWAVGRHSLGYLVVDVFGLGVLAALVTPRRRCLHDLLFKSEVVVGDRSPQPLGTRLRSYWERVEAAREETNQRYRWAVSLWTWLTKLVLRPAIVVLFVAGKQPDSPLGRLRDRLADRVERFVNRLAGNARPETSAPAATSLSANATLGLWAATAGLTGIIVVAAQTVLPTPEIVGTWSGTWQVQRTGRTSFVAVRIGEDSTGSGSGCTFRSGGQEWKIKGRGPRYTGSELWSQGNAGQNCTFEWSTAATFELLDHDTLRRCSTSPFSRREECNTARRTK
ncbi:MAG TPA: RDD family protein [Actinoplanes sp.]|nr:RDD family protein [Actinoplanes sp.]